MDRWKGGTLLVPKLTQNNLLETSGTGAAGEKRCPQVCSKEQWLVQTGGNRDGRDRSKETFQLGWLRTHLDRL